MSKKPESGRMTRREHPSRSAAIREAMKHGYLSIVTPDGIYRMRNSKKQDIAILREVRPRSTVYHLVDAPVDGHVTRLLDVGDISHTDVALAAL